MTVDEFRECKFDSFLYCNYPINIVIPEFIQENRTDIVTDLNVAATNVAELLGSSFETIFPESIEFPQKVGGKIELMNETTADIIWWSNDKNVIFPDKMITALNEELESLGNPLRFKEQENPFIFEGSQGFDWRVATFFALLQPIAIRIATDKSSNMYYYLIRVGLLPSVYWIFQYLYFMAIASVSVVLAIIISISTGRDINIAGYFISAWFHVTFGIFLSSFLKKKERINMFMNFIMILALLTPIIFVWGLPQTESVQNIFKGIQMIPIFFTYGSVDNDILRGGVIISFVFMALSFYLAPLFSVNDGMFEETGRNFFYFLTPKYWKQGIISLPAHKDVSQDKCSSEAKQHDEENNLDKNEILHFNGCIKHFRYVTRDWRKFFSKTITNKTIGPINLTLEVGKINTLLGPNGVGKSTFLKIAGGYYIPSAGEIYFNEENLFRSSYSSLKEISLCPQENYLFEHLTVEEHMKFIASLRDTSKINDISVHIDWILSTLDIADKRSTMATNLSGGMKRRLSLAMAVVGFPKVLLLDEPSSGVDLINQRGIWKLLETAKKHSAILLTSHSSLEALILSDNVVNMETSNKISSNSGSDGLSFSLKQIIDNSAKEYALTDASIDDLYEVITSLPNDGSEWKISSKRLNQEDLLPLMDCKHRPDAESINNDQIQEDDDAINMTNEGDVSFQSRDTFFQQVVTLLKITSLHPDRLFFLIMFAIPLNCGFIWYSTIFSTTNLFIMIPLTPLIYIIGPSIILCNIIFILAQERDLGVAKLVFSQGISRKAYLAHYLVYYGFLSLPVPMFCLIYIGSIFGSSWTSLALALVYFSYFVFHVGLSLFLGSVLDVRTAFVSVNILPTIMGIFGQGSSSNMFANSYPGCTGQVMSTLFINDMESKDWGFFALAVILNILFGTVGLYFFLSKFENHNIVPTKMCSRENVISSSEQGDSETDEEKVGEGETLLEGQNIDKIYGASVKDRASFKALDNVTFAISGGSLLGLVGKSGAGKSTLMEVLSGQISASKGNVLVNGKKVKPSQISKVVSLCSQVDTVWPDMTVLNAIKVFMRCRGYGSSSYTRTKITDPHVSRIIKELDIQDILKKAVKKISGGQKRKLAFLASLLGETKVVLVDEAMTGVDIEARQIMWKILQNEVSTMSRSVVVTTHDISEVEQYCNTVGILHHGKLVEMGQLEDIQKKWNDSVKLMCLVESKESLELLERELSTQETISVGSPYINILDDSLKSGGKGKMVATYPLNIEGLRNIPKLIRILQKHGTTLYDDNNIRYWSIEPMSLDDFVVASSAVKSI